MMEYRKLLRVAEFAALVGYRPATIRKKLYQRQISYHKIGRIIVIPESEAHRLMKDFRPRIDQQTSEERQEPHYE